MLLSKVVYGGKIDSDYDQQLLDSFVQQFFNEKIFESDHFLIANNEFRLKVPEGVRRDQFVAWIDGLRADAQSPAWLGLPANAETLLLTQQGAAVGLKLLRMQQVDDEEEEPFDSLQIGGGGSDEQPTSDLRPAWMRSLADFVLDWLSGLPKALPGLKRSAENIKDPLFR